ncbi:MAG: polysaccharide deacetylase family protein, partial [Candidatus Scalindua sp.]
MGFLKNKAVVLQYQNISDDKENFLDTWIYHKCFEDQLSYFSKNDASIIPLEDTVAYINGDLRLKKQSFSLTFDTGFIELYTLCYPLLKKYGYPATFFIRPDTVGKTETLNGRRVQYMNWDQIRELAKGGATIGLYGCKGKWLSKTPLSEIEDEITKSKSIFEMELKRQTRFYGVREGVPTKPMVNLFKREGLNAVFCQTPTEQRTHTYAIGRIQIDDNDFNIFLVKISKTYILFKDSRYWKYIRQYKIDKAAHRVSDTVNRMKN